MDRNFLSSLILVNDSEKKIFPDDNFNIENIKFNERRSKRMFGIRNERRRGVIRNIKGRPILHLHHTQYKTPGFRVPLKPSQVNSPKVEVTNNDSSGNNENNNSSNGTEIEKEDDKKVEVENTVRKASEEEDIEEIIENAQTRLHINAMKIKMRMTAGTEKKDIVEKLIHRIIQFASHEDLVDLLETLCTLVPSLRGSEVDNYLHYCGI